MAIYLFRPANADFAKFSPAGSRRDPPDLRRLRYSGRVAGAGGKRAVLSWARRFTFGTPTGFAATSLCSRPTRTKCSISRSDGFRCGCRRRHWRGRARFGLAAAGLGVAAAELRRCAACVVFGACRRAVRLLDGALPDGRRMGHRRRRGQAVRLRVRILGHRGVGARPLESRR